MALAYAFTDADGRRYGEPDEPNGRHEFPYAPRTGPFAGQTLTMYAARREGSPGAAWIWGSESWGCYATTIVDELLAMGDTEHTTARSRRGR